MRSTMLSATLALSVVAWFAQTSEASEEAAQTVAPVAPPASVDTVTTTGDSYTCCWVFYAGRWWCIPC